MQYPVFFPDATKGIIKGADSRDLIEASVEGIIVNTFHISNHLGASVIKSAGGIKKFANWSKTVISDSGGFQLMSLIHSKQIKGKISEKGITYQFSGKKTLFTPEKSILTQFAIGSDIMICLDDCPSANANSSLNELSTKRTILWAKKSKNEFDRLSKMHQRNSESRPRLFAVIQGGNDKKLRTICAKELIKIGFDGYGFGGWPLDKNNNLNKDILSFTAKLMPNDLPKYALGVGNPQAIVYCFNMGYQIFDCVLPTRDARHNRLYVYKKDPNNADITKEKDFYEYIYINDRDYIKDFRPVSRFCDCYTCKNYSRAYLRHLTNIKDPSFYRLATIHNLRFYTKLMETLKRHD